MTPGKARSQVVEEDIEKAHPRDQIRLDEVSAVKPTVDVFISELVEGLPWDTKKLKTLLQELITTVGDTDLGRSMSAVAENANNTSDSLEASSIEKYVKELVA